MSESNESESFEPTLFGLPTPGMVDQSGRDPVEQLASEYLDRLRAGERPSIEEYIASNPRHAEGIQELFPLIAAMEDWKSRRELDVVRNQLSTALHLERLGNCRIVREIGRGGMGVVFEAQQEGRAGPVAVKLLPWKSAESSRWRERFLREARLAAGLNHPHVVPVYEFGDHDGMCYYVMPLVQGIGLDRVIQILREEQSVSVSRLRAAFLSGNPAAEPYETPPAAIRSIGEAKTTPVRSDGGPSAISQEANESRILRRDAWLQITRIGIQVAEALQYAHQQGILHRDIKPGNLLLDDKGRVWITDFGLALDKDTESLGDDPHLAGTLRYMAPEQFQGQMDERSDIYSLGVTLFELCTLQPAFAGEGRQSVILSIQTSRRRTLRSVHPGVPSALEAIILRAMARNPRERYQTARELMAALVNFHHRQQRQRWNPIRWLKWALTSRGGNVVPDA